VGDTASTLSRWDTFGRKPLVLLALVAFVDAVDRGVLPGALSKIQDDLGFTDTEAGLIGTAFVLASFVAVMPAGWMADRYSRPRIIAVVLASWGAVSLCTAIVQNLWQFVLVRAMLGIGETVDNPASQSLIADYYPTQIRGRAYAIFRAAPTVGTAVGTALGGAVSAWLGWRYAFLLVGVPGSILAYNIWRMPDPTRTQSGRPVGSLRERVHLLLSIRPLRAIAVGTGIGAGALSGIGFWAPEFYERHTSLTEDQAAGIVGVLILLGAIAGALLGGIARDRLTRSDASAAFRIAAVTQTIGATALMIVFVDVPLGLRITMSVVGVTFVVAGFPALTAMTADLVESKQRGMAFSLTYIASAATTAAAPLLIGFISNRFEFQVDGESKGNLAYAFLIVLPTVFIGALVLWRGRRTVASDA
jgi:MFS family permease